MKINKETISRKQNPDEYDKHYHRCYYERKKAEIKERVSVKSPCEICGKMVQKQHKAKHLKTPSCEIYGKYNILLNQQCKA